MNNTDTQFDIDRYQEALDNTPGTVREFLWSNTFKQMVAELARFYAFDETKQTILENIIFEALIGYADEETTRRDMATLGIDEEKQAELGAYIYDYFVQPIGASTELEYELDREDESEAPKQETVSAPSPADVLASLKSRLTTPNAIAPAIRELPPGPTLQHIKTPPTEKPKLDVYREQV